MPQVPLIYNIRKLVMKINHLQLQHQYKTWDFWACKFVVNKFYHKCGKQDPAVFSVLKCNHVSIFVNWLDLREDSVFIFSLSVFLRLYKHHQMKLSVAIYPGIVIHFLDSPCILKACPGEISPPPRLPSRAPPTTSTFIEESPAYEH